MKKVIIIALCAVLVIGAVVAGLMFIPVKQELHYDMRGYIMKPDGTVLEAFTFTVTGETYDFIIDRPGASGISFTGERITEVKGDSYAFWLDWSGTPFEEKNGFGFFHGIPMPNGDPLLTGGYDYFNGIQFEYWHAALEKEKGTFCMYGESLYADALIVGITNPDTDPQEVVDEFLDRVHIQNFN